MDAVYNLRDFACDWTKNGYRLPTEAEWTYAAKGSNGHVYAWGDHIDGTYCNQVATKRPYSTVFTPVGFFNGETRFGIATKDNASPFGLYDMTGNVWSSGPGYTYEMLGFRVAKTL